MMLGQVAVSLVPASSFVVPPVASVPWGKGRLVVPVLAVVSVRQQLHIVYEYEGYELYYPLSAVIGSSED